MSDAHYSKSVPGVFNISSRVMRCGSSGAEGVSKVLVILGMVGRQLKYIGGLGGVFLIQQHHLACYPARTQFA